MAIISNSIDEITALEYLRNSPEGNKILERAQELNLKENEIVKETIRWRKYYNVVNGFHEDERERQYGQETPISNANELFLSERNKFVIKQTKEFLTEKNYEQKICD